MKFVKSFKDYNSVSEALKMHVDEGLDLTNSFFRLGSDAYCELFEEVKQYWDKGNVILKGPSGWMAKNLEVGKKAIYKESIKRKLIGILKFTRFLRNYDDNWFITKKV